MSDLPAGTVTFLFSDIEGSTNLLQRLGANYARVLTAHQILLRSAWTAHNGYEVSTEGDSFFVAFSRADDAISAAADAQRALALYPWPEDVRVRVRMGIHTGTPTLAASNYVGLDVHRAARIASAGHGGQILLSHATRELVYFSLSDDISIRNLGEHRLKDLQQAEHLYQLVISDLPTEFPPLKTLNSHRHNLPIQPTSLIGRDSIVHAVCELLRQEHVKLVTLTGPGGMGKTRLALQVVAELVSLFSNGAYFIALDLVTDPHLVPATIAQVLKLRDTQQQSLEESLKSYLAEKRTLLVLDNFEQVTAAAPFVARLQASCVGLKILVTSRIPLHLRGEKEYPVPSLALPEVIGQMHAPDVDMLTQYPAIALFIERAQDVKPDFQVTADNVEIIASICNQLDGVPLAIELAATRIKLLSPQVLLTRLSNRLQLLTAGARDLPERQRTLRGTIAWSYDLLTPVEKIFFTRFSVFVAGCTFEAVESICVMPDNLAPLTEDALELLGSLVDKNLLQQQQFQTVDHTSSLVMEEQRFRMLEIIRDYALERFAASQEAEILHQVHATYYLTLAEQAYVNMLGSEPGIWLNQLEREHRNLIAALDWAHARQELVIEARLAGSLWPFWLMQGHFKEGHHWLDRLVAQRSLPVQNNVAHETQTTQAAQTSPLSPSIWQRLLRGAGALALQHGDYKKSIELLEQSVALARLDNDGLALMDAVKDLGFAFQQTGALEPAMLLYEECLMLARQLDHSLYIASALNNLGLLAKTRGDLDLALTLYEEALALSRQVSTPQGVAVILANLGTIARMQGNLGYALSLLQDSLKITYSLRYLLMTANRLEMLADLSGTMGHGEHMARLLGAASVIHASLKISITPPAQKEMEQRTRIAKKMLGDDVWSTAFVAGQTNALDAIVEEILQWTY